MEIFYTDHQKIFHHLTTLQLLLLFNNFSNISLNFAHLTMNDWCCVDNDMLLPQARDYFEGRL